MNTGIDASLGTLGRLAMAYRLTQETRRIAIETIAAVGPVGRKGYMLALVRELHHRADSTLHDPSVPEALRVVGSDEPIPQPIDADDACLFVASCALSIGIPCRFVAQRYGQSWTVRLRYEVAGQWETIDCMNQSTTRETDEEIVGEELKG